LTKHTSTGEQRDSNDDSDESEDEDFVAGETPDTSPSSSSESEEEEGADRKKKKKKKVLKETEIGKQKERRVSVALTVHCLMMHWGTISFNLFLSHKIR
jgi:hypothetical protein